MIVTIFSTQRPSRAHAARPFSISHPSPLAPRAAGFTLVEMLIAISITLVMMSVVVGVFATLSESVSKRRSAIEVGTQLRHVRNVLQRDLEGATCPVIPWQRPESDVGYFEIVEGPYADFYPSLLTDGRVGGANTSSTAIGPEIDYSISTIPSSDVPVLDGEVTNAGGLGDHDDVLAFTSRNEKEPFTGPAPLGNVGASGGQNPFVAWASQSISSPVAEVVWFCMENPPEEYDALSSFGEAGFRTIYRRTLLVAPWLDYRYDVGGGPKSRPGVLRILDRANVTEAQALAALIAFQERYDISARINFDPTIRNDGRWTIVANTLADLTDRKNRFEHHGYVEGAGRRFPYVTVSKGFTDDGNAVRFYADAEAYPGGNVPTSAQGTLLKSRTSVLGVNVTDPSSGYLGRPFVAIEGGATARAMTNENGQITYVTTGLVPLGVTGQRTTRVGADLMLADALAFDVQVFDPNAPVYGLRTNGRALLRRDNDLGQSELDFTAVGPGSAGWWSGFAQYLSVNDPNSNDNPLVVREGAYADLGYAALHAAVNNVSLPAVTLSTLAGLPNNRSLPVDSALTRVYDTWNFGYENDGVNQDLDEVVNGGWRFFGNGNPTGTPLIDEGTDGFDSFGDYPAGQGLLLYGPDDPGERETSPPYPVPLRAVQVKLRAYEPDSRQMREVTVRQHFVPE
ncbi:PulJ/GspJ family protein [Aeoliella sp. SH292]|uniref:PulJ/GspJ family protein n=1 Tax=Aeoliella sp. SH292 TaxID=3454464 RepID=UPI003F975234